jgi:hypothetical protein
MTAMRLRSFRSGDLAEGLGVEMLRRFAAVAEVPREEDFGIDAVCTLLRPAGDRVFAEDTFAVQVKSGSSSEHFDMSEDSCRWLRDLDIPLFLLDVDLARGSARVFTYEWAVEELAPAALSAQRGSRTLVTVIPKNRRSVVDSQPAILGDPSTLEPDMRWLWLGPPITAFALGDLVDDARVESLYRLMKAWCVHVKRSISLRRQKIRHQSRWETDVAPTRSGGLGVEALPEDAAEVAEGLALLLERAEVVLLANRVRDRSRVTAARALVTLLDDLARQHAMPGTTPAIK